VRLTLRTLLAYLDDTLDPNEIKQIGQKVAESDAAQELIARIKQVTRRRRLTAPPPTGAKFDANDLAEYLDNVLPNDKVAELEKLCLESDTHLAEVAACHQILTLVLGEPALVPPKAKERMYGLVQGKESIKSRRAPAPARAAVSQSGADRSAEDDALLLGLPAMERGQGNWLRWLIPVAGALLAVALGFAIWQALSHDREPDRVLVAQGGRTKKVGDRPKKGARDVKETREGTTGRDGPSQKDAGTPKDATPKKDNGAGKDDRPKKEGGPPKEGGRPKEGGKDGPRKVDPPAGGMVQPPPRQPDKARLKLGTVALKQESPDLLVRATDDPRERWKRVAAGTDPVSGGDLLVSLPGFRSMVLLDSGVDLLLWGNVGEQLPLPILDAAVVLHKPPRGYDADFTLDRGRVIVFNHREGKQEAQVLVRFHKETWELAMGPGAEVGLELVGRDIGFAVERTEEEPAAALTLIVRKGKVTLRDDFHEYALNEFRQGACLFTWDNKGRGSRAPISPPAREESALEAAWMQFPRIPEQYRDMEAALDTLRTRLSNRQPVSLGVQEMVHGDKEKYRFLGTLCLGALDYLSELIDALEDKDLGVREAAVIALRQWLGRKAGQDKLLKEQLLKKRYTEGQANNVLHLLRVPQREDVEKRETYAMLIDHLDSDKPGIRQLAIWHLYRLVPRKMVEDNQLMYDPTGRAEQREAMAANWKKVLDKGQLPPPLPSSSSPMPMPKPPR